MNPTDRARAKQGESKSTRSPKKRPARIRDDYDNEIEGLAVAEPDKSQGFSATPQTAEPERKENEGNGCSLPGSLQESTNNDPVTIFADEWIPEEEIIKRKSIVHRLPRSCLIKEAKDDWIGSKPQILIGQEKTGVFVHQCLARMTGSGTRALVLAQILYWFQPNERGRPRVRIRWPRSGGLYWLVKTHKELAEETGLSTNQVKNAMKWLREKKLIRVEYHRFKGFKSSYIRPDTRALLEAYEAIEDQIEEPEELI